MPSVPDRMQLRSEEQPEFALTGPFGGIQSELPITQIETLGFYDARDVVCRLGGVQPRPGRTNLPAFPTPVSEPTLAVFTFYNVNGNLIQGVITPTRLLQYASGAWTQITGPALTGASNQLFSWDIVNYKLCFCQGSNTVLEWDGIAGTYTAPAGAPAAKYVAEIGLHLVTGGIAATPNRYIWSGIGDPTDWSSVNSGLDDIVNNLGPINWITKIGQYGFGFHQNGIMQIIPTGIGINPFAFVPMVNTAIGTTAPYSIAKLSDQGRDLAFYLGQDNVYVFDGSSVEPIGDAPINDGSRRRLGARSRILADVFQINPNLIVGGALYSLVGQVFKSYWLGVPGVSVWCYNLDEGNWTYFLFNDFMTQLGPFQNVQNNTIGNLLGSISSQKWSPATLANVSIYPGMLIGFEDGVTSQFSFATACENNSLISSGKLIFQDRRHKKSIKKFRLSFLDQGPVTFTLLITAQNGQSQSFVFPTLGTGSGDVLNYVQEFNLPGLRFQYTVTIPSGTFTSIVELAPMYDTTGEQRGGTIEN